MDPLRILLSMDKKNLVFTSNFFLKRQSTTITSTTVWISTTSTFFFSRKKKSNNVSGKKIERAKVQNLLYTHIVEPQECISNNWTERRFPICRQSRVSLFSLLLVLSAFTTPVDIYYYLLPTFCEQLSIYCKTGEKNCVLKKNCIHSI